MPNLKEDNPQFPERSSGSFLRAAVAATPLTIGVTAAMRGVSTDGSIKQPREAGIDQAMRHLAKRNYNGPYIPSVEEVNRFMSKQPGGLAKHAWDWATQTVDPFTRNRMLGYTEGIEHMTEAEARSAISQTVTGNESAAMSRIWRKFQMNMETLKVQQALTDTIPTFTKVDDLVAFAQRRTVPLPTEMPTTFADRVQKIAQALGAQKRIYGLTRPEMAAEGYGVWNVVFRGTPAGDLKLQLPQIVQGVMLEGSDLQTRRIAPDVVTMRPGAPDELTRMSRTEFFLKEVEESIVPDITGGRLKSQRDIEQAVKQLKAKVFGEMEAVPNVTMAGRTAAQAQREALRGKAVDIVVMEEEARRGGLEYKPGFRKPTSREISEVMESAAGRAMGLRGGVGPKALSEGRLSTVDWERFYIGDVDYGRRPEQKFREFQATRETMEALGQAKADQKYRAADMVGEDIAYDNVARPKLKATYIDPKRHAAFLEEIAMGEGEAIMRRERAFKMQFEQSAAVKLAIAREDIGDFQKIAAGELLGVTPEGKTFQLPRGAKIGDVRRLTDDVLQVEYMRQHQLRHGDKMFGGAKAVLLMRKQKEFMDIARRLQLGDEAMDMFINMDELKKNRSLHKTQIISALEELIRGNWLSSRGGAPGEGITRQFFLGQGEAVGRTWAKNATHKEWIATAMKTAIQNMDLSAREFGTVFGAVPHVLNLDDKQTADFLAEAIGLSKTDEMGIRKLAPYWEALRTGTAGGMAEMAYGGPRLDVGGLGSLEPRAFDILQSGAMGAEGKQIGKELAERLAITNPAAVIAHEELGKTLSSMTRDVDLAGKAVYKQGTSFQKFVEAGGGVIRPGKGMRDIYVPGADVMRQMRPFETTSGVTVRGAVSDIYHDIAYKAGQFREGQLTTKEFQQEMNIAADMLRTEWAPAGKGIGSITRGKLMGSRFLRGVSAQTAGATTAIRDPYTIGVTQAAFTDMVEELRRTGKYEKEALTEMSERFVKGEGVGGLLARHPFLGEFSVQPIMMQMVEGEKDLMVLPEVKENIRVRTGRLGQYKEKTLTLGPLVGLAGDKDADAYSAILLGPRSEEAIRKRILLQDSEFASRYAQHQVRMQLFKPPKAPPGTLPTVSQMIADVEKLGVGQKWIAPLSLEMTAAKRALTRHGQGQAAADARFLLEWLEQTPVGAKHMRAEQAKGGGLQSLMESITDSIQQRNSKRLEANIASIVKDDATAKAMLSGNVYLDKSSAAALTRNLGVNMQQKLKGVDVPNATKELMRVLSESDASGATRKAELLAGRGAMAKMSEIAELSAMSVFRSVDSPNMFSRISTAMIRTTNFLGQAGRGIIKNHKTIGLGFAGSLALSAALSSPPETVGSGISKIPDARLNMNRRKAANRMKPEDLQPPAQPVGSPTAPQMMQNQNVRLAQNRPRMSMRTTIHAPPDADLATMTAQLGSIGTNTSVNLRDSRTKLHPREIADKLL